MIQENEILALVLAFGVLVFFIMNRASLNRTPAAGLLFTGLCMLILAWIFSILEGFFWGVFFNLVEHGLYLLSAVCLAVWTIRMPMSHHGMEK